MINIQPYIQRVLKLKTDRSRGAPAPHKPVLLLAVIDSIDAGEIVGNRIYITEDLLGRFWENWALLVDNPRFHPKFALPFFHLQSDGFWHLRAVPGREILVTSSGSIKSFKALKEGVQYAYLDEPLFVALLDEANRLMLRNVLLQTYFPEKGLHGAYGIDAGVGTSAGAVYNMLQEQVAEYTTAFKITAEEVTSVRGAIFKRVVPKIYNYTCCVSRTRVVSTRDVQLVDACHIVPISESADDTITNGLSLTPSMHRAFDRFLFSIDKDYRVVLSPHYKEQGHPFLKVFEGERIVLPGDREYYPAVKNLQWHYDRFRVVNECA